MAASIIGTSALKTAYQPTIIYLDFPKAEPIIQPDLGLNILSCGAGMISTTLTLMSCENKVKGIIHRHVPVYDAVLFCDMGHEPPWVYSQVRFMQDACRFAKIPFYILKCNLHQYYLDRFGQRHVVSIPFWNIGEDGKRGKMPRNCTIDWKIKQMQNFTRWHLLGYKKGSQMRDIDRKRHVFHLGFSYEERRRCKENKHPMFKNRFPLVEMKWTRADCYAYNLDVWGLETKASACVFCPFHQNYFFRRMKLDYQEDYEKLLHFDDHLEAGQKTSLIKSELYISRARKRIIRLDDFDCDDAQCFQYGDNLVWNGF